MSIYDEQLASLRAIVGEAVGEKGVQIIKAKSDQSGAKRHIKLVSQRKCNFCNGWANTIVRVFASEAEFQASPYYGGGDLVINDPNASRAVWPGKSNAGRAPDDWWICIPVHPFCSCHWNPYEPGEEEGEDYSHTDEIFERIRQERKKEQAAIRAEYEAELKANRESNRAARMQKSEASMILARELALLRERVRTERFEKTAHVRKGLMHHHSCACDHLEEEVETDSWTRRYLREYASR